MLPAIMARLSWLSLSFNRLAYHPYAQSTKVEARFLASLVLPHSRRRSQAHHLNSVSPVSRHSIHISAGIEAFVSPFPFCDKYESEADQNDVCRKNYHRSVRIVNLFQ